MLSPTLILACTPSLASVKTAGPFTVPAAGQPALTKAAPFLSGMSGRRGAMVGGMLGAAVGAMRPGTDENGEERGALGGALRGAARGAVVGGATGFAGKRLLARPLMRDNPAAFGQPPPAPAAGDTRTAAAREAEKDAAVAPLGARPSIMMPWPGAHQLLARRGMTTPPVAAPQRPAAAPSAAVTAAPPSKVAFVGAPPVVGAQPAAAAPRAIRPLAAAPTAPVNAGLSFPKSRGQLNLGVSQPAPAAGLVGQHIPGLEHLGAYQGTTPKGFHRFAGTGQEGGHVDIHPARFENKIAQLIKTGAIQVKKVCRDCRHDPCTCGPERVGPQPLTADVPASDIGKEGAAKTAARKTALAPADDSPAHRGATHSNDLASVKMSGKQTKVATISFFNPLDLGLFEPVKIAVMHDTTDGRVDTQPQLVPQGRGPGPSTFGNHPTTMPMPSGHPKGGESEQGRVVVETANPAEAELKPVLAPGTNTARHGAPGSIVRQPHPMLADKVNASMPSEAIPVQPTAHDGYSANVVLPPMVARPAPEV
jgi:hypothetical protein